MISVHARVQKPFRKKCKKTRSGVPPEQRTPRQELKMRMCVHCKSKENRNSTHRKWQQERDPERPAPTLQRRTVFFEQKVFFQKQKKCVFSSMLGNCTRGPNIGATLRRPSWPCLESILLFNKKNLKKNTRAVARRDFRLATGNTLT